MPAPRFPLPEGLQRTMGRFVSRRTPDVPAPPPSPPAADSALQNLGERLQQAREARGLSRRQLALETRISTAVLEALERGWTDRLPEPAFLGTILAKLAQRLELPAEDLQVSLRAAATARRSGRSQDPTIDRFTLSSINLFTTWQGTIAYLLLLAAGLYLLNLQRQQLVASNGLSLRPIPASAPTRSGPGTPGTDQRPVQQQLLTLYPELRPLEAPAPTPLERLEQDWNADRSGSPVRRPDTLTLRLPEGVGADQVEARWNGQPLQPDPGRPGTYRLLPRP
ncbi:MAG: helix-turn-helix domain-containing protein [Prochlorococcaceae cyanobacterium]